MSLLISIFFWIWTLQIFAEKVVTNVALIAIATAIIGLTFLTTAVITMGTGIHTQEEKTS